MAKIVVFGTVVADIALRFSALPKPGDAVSATALGWRLGGSSANLACGLASAGHSVELIGPVGADAMAQRLLVELEGRGVSVKRVIRVARPTPRTLILLDDAGERTIVQLDIESATNAFPLADIPDIEDADCVFVEGYDRFSPSIADQCPAALLVVTPPVEGAERWPAHVILGSERQYSPALLSRPYEHARELAGPGLSWVIVTRGRNGADAFGRDGSSHVQARKAKQVDATGAGDAFAAGVISALLGKKGIQEALESGAAQGAAAVASLQSIPADWIDPIEVA